MKTNVLGTGASIGMFIRKQILKTNLRLHMKYKKVFSTNKLYGIKYGTSRDVTKIDI